MSEGVSDDKWESGPPPKDGTEIVVLIQGRLRVFWSDKRECWVLSVPLNVETMTEEPKLWRAAK